MIKVMYAAKRRADMSFDEFRRYWLTTHADLMMKVPGLQRYVISIAHDSGDGDARPFDGFAEVAYADAEAMRLALESPEAEAMLADEVNLFDTSSSVRLVVDDIPVLA